MVGERRSNVAVNEVAWSIRIRQEPVPVQGPLQPANVEPGAATALSVTKIPNGKSALQLVPQRMPTGSEVTVPLPSPAFVRLSLTLSRSNCALTVCELPRVSWHAPWPMQAPLQATNREPAAGVAARVTRLPAA